MIYAIEAVGTGMIKFGLASNVERRLRHLQIGCPVDLKLLASCDGDRRSEEWVHYRLCCAEAFARGEWFKDCDEARKIIAEMQYGLLKPERVNTSAMHHERSKYKRADIARERRARGDRGAPLAASTRREERVLWWKEHGAGLGE